MGGTAKRFDLSPLVTKVCTPNFVAPEVLKKNNVEYTEKCDVWACGIILYLMLGGCFPFEGSSDLELLKKIKKGKFEFKPAATRSRPSASSTRPVRATSSTPSFWPRRCPKISI